MSFKLTYKIHLFLLLILSAVIILFYDEITNILVNFMLQPFINYPSRSFIINFYLYYILLGIIIAFFHELVHGTVYKRFGGKVKYGFKLIFAYTMEVSGKAISRNEFLVVLLSPAVIISLAAILMPSWIGNMIFLINLLGSIGDIYMGIFLCKFRHNVRIIDRPYGFDIV